MNLGIDMSVLSRGVVALERIANALERIAGATDRLNEYQPRTRVKRKVETVHDPERFG